MQTKRTWRIESNRPREIRLRFKTKKVVVFLGRRRQAMEGHASTSHWYLQRFFRNKNRDGQWTKGAIFWDDNWINYKLLKYIAAHMFPIAKRKRRTIAEQIQNKTRIRTGRKITTVKINTEYVIIWQLLREVSLKKHTRNVVAWKWTANGEYSAESAYPTQFFWHIHPIRHQTDMASQSSS